MNRLRSLKPELDASTENRLLRRHLDSLTDEASYNQEVLRRFHERELSLLRAETLPELLTSLTEGMQQSFGLPALSLLLVDPDHELRHLLLHDSKGPDQFQNIRFLDRVENLPTAVNNLSKPLLGPFQSEHSTLFPTNDIKLGSVALLPLIRRETLVGCLNLGCRDPKRFTRHHACDFLHHLATIAAVCMESAANREHLVISGLTDALTGLHNRRYLERRLQEEVARAQRYNHPLSCLFIDADHFKRINDKHGHATGDEVLREISLRVRECLRASDMATRFGGEEFTLLLPQTDAEEAINLAERIRLKIYADPIGTRSGSELRVSISIGVSQLVTTGEENCDAAGDRLLKEADAALYQAKEEGRNRVRLFGSD
jgi:diguanylate cyclase (GGDEF)-like protein